MLIIDSFNQIFFLRLLSNGKPIIHVLNGAPAVMHPNKCTLLTIVYFYNNYYLLYPHLLYHFYSYSTISVLGYICAMNAPICLHFHDIQDSFC